MDPSLSVEKFPHHEQMQFCLNRAKYRQGRKLTAVKVYTVNDESKYLIINGVPAIKIKGELEVLCLKYGDVDILQFLPDYPHEEFTEAYLLKYHNIKNARFAKKQLDGKSFYGGVLHTCYAPELESVEETREKLQERRKTIAALTRYQQDSSLVNAPKSNRANSRHTISTVGRYLAKLKPELRKEHINILHRNVSEEPAEAVTRDNGTIEPVSTASSYRATQDSDGAAQCQNRTGNPNHSTSSSYVNDNTSFTNVGGSLVSQASSNIESGSLRLVSNKRQIHGSKETLGSSAKKIKVFGNKNILVYKH